MSRFFLCRLILCAIPVAAYAADAPPPPAAAPASGPATSEPANDFERIAQQTVDILDHATADLVPVKDEATAREAAVKLAALKKDVEGMKASMAKLGEPTQDVQTAAMDKYAKRIESSYLHLAAQQMRVRSDPKLDAIVGKPLDELGLIRAEAKHEPTPPPTTTTTTTAPSP